MRKAPTSPIALIVSPPPAPRSEALSCALLLALAAALVGFPAAAQAPAGRYLEEAKALEADPAMQQAFDRVKELDPWGMRLLLELTQIPAPPFKEEARAKRYAELLKEAGADSVWIDEEGNVLALRRGLGGGRTVALAGHLDTVFPEGTDVTVHQRGDTLFAPGIGDDTRGLIVVLTALRAMVETGVRTRDDLLFVGVVGEEGLGDLRGMKHLFRDGARPIAAWVDIDGGDLDGITAMGLGSVRYRVTFKGPGGHSWGAFGLANPAHALARSVSAFENVADTLTRRGPRTSYNVGVIGGGTSVNAV
ncbi:MAG: M20/M25/M40 family metallo-hydrolase, partial [Gemmatimonadetes bacterium]|nr:M20/M25/M40 family metallo-hydrolase [Gemmatimonadota bacterium]